MSDSAGRSNQRRFSKASDNLSVWRAVSVHAVADAKRAQVGEDFRHDGFVGDALASKDLDAAIDRAPYGFGHRIFDEPVVT